MAQKEPRRSCPIRRGANTWEARLLAFALSRVVADGKHTNALLPREPEIPTVLTSQQVRIGIEVSERVIIVPPVITSRRLLATGKIPLRMISNMRSVNTSKRISHPSQLKILC